MAEFHGLGSKFDGFQSSTSGSSSSPFVQASDTSTHTSLSLTSSVCLPPLSTHDTEKSHHHIEDFERFVEDLQTSAKRAFPNSDYSRYNDVQVLLIQWDEDELQVEGELNELRRVFNLYGFTTTKFRIPTSNSHRKLNQKVLSFVEEHENEDALLVIYYGGHGIINKARQSTWSCKRDKSYATVEWSAIQTLFETAKCDVLLLLDCCAAASAAPLTERTTYMMETIAACGFETWTSSPGAQSFTHTLIEVLKEWASQLPFSAAMLHSEILTRLKHAPPDRSSQGVLVESRKTPTYIVSTSNAHASSITLGKMPEEEESSSISSSRAIPDSSIMDFTERVQSDACYSTEDRIQALLATDTKGQRAAPHVLLTVALEEDQVFDAASCARWLKQFPLLATHVSVEAVYRSYSTLLILSVPVVIWDLLPELPATQFVGYVRTRNLLSRDMALESAAAPIPITTRHTAGNKTGDLLDCTSPLRSVSGLSSLDSGYDSFLSRPGSLVVLRHNRLPGDGAMSSVAGQVRMGKRRNKPSTVELLGPERLTSMPTDTRPSLKQRPGSSSRGSNRLVVSIGEADLNGDRIGHTCVLWYGYDVQQSRPTEKAAPKPTWNEDFRFRVHNSPMCHHLRVSVWGVQMLELFGEVHIDLCELVKRGQLPKLEAWQTLRCNGIKTGSIHIKLTYIDAREDEEQQSLATEMSAAERQEQRRKLERQGSDDGQARAQQMDFRVW
ncbi:unnamed protein product [Fusarium graminearum]|uniref:Chromosome 1, complete genome n=2 Tax=Gibberella zeae TaxID=5518 RepID=A0A1C3YIT7_GIBZE|nr:hypothetical protein FGRA07_00149 [Fusarium graminearum]CAF3502709.1 unnamed protein product [Fusarium graminearum]CAF3606722.1 unnamed protein product [Fusarium graminearum]CAG1969058.1 unnamed protein product [Fusarium graminearum]CAG2004519.1 unnamed protein product [Fusarium graminearum]